jgi:chromosome condensin MukBEF MukE localization factor
VKRLFWLALGATVGILVMRKVSRAIEKLTPRGVVEGIGAGLADLADSISDFASDVRRAMTEREAQLREDTGMDGTLGKPPPPERAAG